MLKTGHGESTQQGRTWGFGSRDANLRSCSGNAERWCPHPLNLFTKLSHYLLCVRISLGCGGVGQMGFKTLPSGTEQAELDRWAPRHYRKALNTWEEKGEGRKKAGTPSSTCRQRSQYEMWETCRVSTHPSSHSWNKDSSPGDAGLRLNSCKYLFGFLISLLLTDVLEGNLCSKVPQCFFNECF